MSTSSKLAAKLIDCIKYYYGDFRGDGAALLIRDGKKEIHFNSSKGMSWLIDEIEKAFPTPPTDANDVTEANKKGELK